MARAMRTLALLPLLVLLGAGLAGCTGDDGSGGDGDGGLVHNACTEHPKYGTGNPTVTLRTSLGNITAEVFVDQVPNTGMNFVKLVEAGEYNNTPFHRIISNFMMQGGDYELGNGRGGSAHPDCADANGNVVDEYTPELRHAGKGWFSMANTGQLNSGSSQFFITFTATPHLDAYDTAGNKKACGSPGVSCHAVFAHVTAGLDVVDKVNQQAGSQSGTPRTPVTLLNATVAWP